MDELKRLLEALIFVSDTPLTLERLAALTEQAKSVLRPLLRELLDDFPPGRHGFYLAEIADGYQFRTASELAPELRQLSRERPFRFSRAALETLAIIAYRQPITRAEIEYLRGVDSGGVIKTLLEKELLRILGKKDVPGRPIMYGTSRYFLEFFGLRELADLPTLKEFSALEPELAEAIPLEPDTEGHDDG